MESQGTYQAGTPADESATPEKVVPMRQPWAQIQMDILTLGARCFSLGATRCLLYLVRYTIGFHTTTVKLTVDEFCKGKRRKDGGRFDGGTDLSRPSVLTGLHELERARVIAISNEGHGRGTVATYELFPVECWQVERISIGKKSLPINDKASIGKESSPIAASNGKSSLPKRRIIGKKSLPHINIDTEKKSPEERNDLLSDASTDALRTNDTPHIETPGPAPEKPAEKPAAKTRKVFAADSDAYRLALHLRDGILRHKPDARVPRAETQLQQWAGVIDLMLRIDGRTPERVRSLIDAIMTNPRIVFWRGVILSPGKLREKFDQIEIQLRERGGYNRPSQPTTPPPSSPDTDDALTRNGVATRERIRRERREREAAEVAAKGANL